MSQSEKKPKVSEEEKLELLNYMKDKFKKDKKTLVWGDKFYEGIKNDKAAGMVSSIIVVFQSDEKKPLN